MFKWHVTVMDIAVSDIPENTTDSGQADSLCQHSAEILAVFQVNKNLLKKILGFFFPDIRNDPGSVDNTVYGT
jgi:hypothetical protein